MVINSYRITDDSDKALDLYLRVVLVSFPAAWLRFPEAALPTHHPALDKPLLPVRPRKPHPEKYRPERSRSLLKLGGLMMI